MATFAAQLHDGELRYYKPDDVTAWLGRAREGMYTVAISRVTQARRNSHHAKYRVLLKWCEDHWPHVDADMLHKAACAEILGTMRVGGHEVPKSSTGATVAQQSAMGDWIVRMAAEHDVAVPLEVWE